MTANHDDTYELVPLADADEHGKVQPPPVAPAPIPPPPAAASPVITEPYRSEPASAEIPAPADPSLPPLILPGFPGASLLIIVGAILTIAAVGLTGYFAPNHTVVRAISTFYDIALHTGTGVVALYIASVFTERRFNDARLGASRIFVAVALLYTVVNIPMPIPLKIEEWILGLAAYGLALWGLFRLSRNDLGLIAVTHAGLWLLVKLGASLQAFMESQPVP